MKKLLPVVFLLSLAGCFSPVYGQISSIKQQTAAQRDSAVTDSLLGPDAPHIRHNIRIFEIPPTARPRKQRRTKKLSTP
jgi:hypothetical protein